jgi:hypothetical protein
MAFNGFFPRLGPVVRADIYLPRILNGTTLSAEYHFLPSLTGRNGRDFYYTVGAEFDI